MGGIDPGSREVLMSDTSTGSLLIERLTTEKRLASEFVLCRARSILSCIAEEQPMI